MKTRMLTFLKEAKHYIDSKKSVTIVLGNESCDLDSAVSATCLAYFYQMIEEQKQHDSLVHHCAKSKYYIPVLNIPRQDYVIKTEVEYVFSKHAILSDVLTFRDDLSEELMKNSEIILVDHHVSPFIKQCLEVFDHRPLDKSVEFPEKCKVTIENVGSCATLIAEAILAGIAEDTGLKAVCGFPVLSLLRSTIILDTVNFSEKAQRTTPKDLKICDDLESAIDICANCSPEPRGKLFESLVEARQHVSELTVLQILRKDLKMLTHSKSNTTIALAGFPINVKHLIAKPEAKKDIQQFATHNNISVILLMGMFVQESDGSVHRDIGIINIREASLCDSIKTKLLNLKEPDLELEKYEDLNFLDGEYFKQLNIKATRKHIMPVVNFTLHEWSKAHDDE